MNMISHVVHRIFLLILSILLILSNIQIAHPIIDQSQSSNFPF
ncbi:MAG: hypothetical protein BMS9Abin36_0671 [Gammaproteobacteria bacterium]|nr:MAG: hypothetical protein BMS9Abin36_0671 [Gammaproteobacteria bacterium]